MNKGFNTNDDIKFNSMDEVAPTILFDYLIRGLSLTAIEKELFKTVKYKGWISKIILNFYGVETDSQNKGIFKGLDIKEVIKILNSSDNEKHQNVAKLLLYKI